MSTATSSPAVGVDLGGTATRFALLDGEEVVATEIRSTPSDGRPDEVLAQLVDGIRHVAAGRPVPVVGIGASGPVDLDGVIRNPDTLPVYTGLDVVAAVSDVLGCPVVIDNDAVTAALGEVALGAARGSRDVLTVTLGTGVGVARIRDRAPVRGADGQHPEAGHLSIAGVEAPCYCGRRSCFEQAASRAALERRAVSLVGGDGAAALEELADRAGHGDPPARAAFDAYGRLLGAGLADLLTVARSDLVVLGGSAARHLPLFADAVDAALAEVVGCFPPVEVVAAELGTFGGAIGAAVLGRDGLARHGGERAAG